MLGETARRAGAETLAHGRFSASLRSFAALRDGGGVADCLDGLGRLSAADGDPERAGRLLGAAERLRELCGTEPIRAGMRLSRTCPPRREAGRAMAFDEAAAYALST